MLVTRMTAAGTEQITFLQAVLALAHESRLSIDEASAALRTGFCRTFSSLYSTEIDNMSADVEVDFEFDDDDFEFDSDDDEQCVWVDDEGREWIDALEAA